MMHIATFTFNPFQENTYILYNDSNECLIIDPGCYESHEEKQLLSFIEDKKLLPKALVNTHGHLDHMCGNAFVLHHFDIPFYIHRLESDILTQAPAYAGMFGVKINPSPSPTHWLEPGSLFHLGADTFQLLFTPGHSPGSVSLYHEPAKLIISGDVLFQGSIGRTDLPGGDFKTLIQSIQRELFPLPDDTVVYSGHGSKTTLGEEKKHNPFVGDRALHRSS